ncbi:MBL fold metallo-hydrolase [Candidatus Cyrtobacter comes]|uniref:MBL fold metallo-hydrolase n=1 Tax=Candidatus Cyrtobacter comes TaxID=675776 RepID=A0ABU5L953_9RICK|nr:MBL fold metallo-hydrolase [Candidatus Cyrtobacter comes]MDZ5762440.1 MBL fold metallo-hydrolase [Candidatus Cyrtobacter comes]
MICTILGCGGSSGVPIIGCCCVVCKSTNAKNKRARASILIEKGNTKVLVDTSPDLRYQAISHGLLSLDAVLITHDHSDHVGGIHDLKMLTKSKTIPIYAPLEAMDYLKAIAFYLFEQKSKWYPVCLKLHELKDEFLVNDIMIQSFIQEHGTVKSYGFRFGDLAYSTDVNKLNSNAFKILQGVKVWIVDCLRYHWSPTHSIFEQTLEWIYRVKPERAVLTHMSHEIDYDEIAKLLPSGIEAAYDGMRIQINS